MMRGRLIAAGAFATLLGSNASVAAQSPDRSSIHPVQDAFQAAVRSWDVEGWSDLFTDEAVMLTPFAQTIVGRDAFRSYWIRAWEGRRGSAPNPLALTQKEVLEDDDLAVVRLDYGPEGREPVGQYVWALVREADGWRIAWWMFTRRPLRKVANG